MAPMRVRSPAKIPCSNFLGCDFRRDQTSTERICKAEDITWSLDTASASMKTFESMAAVSLRDANEDVARGRSGLDQHGNADIQRQGQEAIGYKQRRKCLECAATWNRLTRAQHSLRQQTKEHQEAAKYTKQMGDTTRT